ncbi:MAG: peptidase M48, partial [Pseudomonadota bacterium]
AAGMSAFFDRLSGIDGAFEIPEFLASHPETAARGRAAQEFAQVQKDTQPALSGDAWLELRGICD